MVRNRDHMEHQVFISYSSADKASADTVCGALEAAGIRCWMAPRDIEAGTNYPSAIVDAVNAAKVLVLIVTEHGIKSPHVLSEVGHAFNSRIRILPFRLASVALPEDLEYFLSMTQWLDAFDGCSEENLKRLTNAVADALAGKDKVGRARKRSRRKLILASVAVSISAAALLGYWQWTKYAEMMSIPMGPRPASTVAPASTGPKTWVNPKDSLTYVWIAPGSFTMGCSTGDGSCGDNEKPAHRVDIEKGFWLGQTEVTIGAYRKFAAAKGRKLREGDGNLPVTEVAWPEAKAYCAAMGGRLPTEAEWEYAARGGKPEPYYGVPSKIAWYAENSNGTAHPVGTKDPNPLGLYDMLGNVSEWVLDRYYNKYYADSVATGPTVEQPLAGNASAVARGAFWDADAAALRVSHRSEVSNDEPVATVGFRCASDHE